MAETTPQKGQSKVPQHLRRFHHASKSYSDLTSEPSHLYSFALPKPSNPVELCPPHWRLPERQPLKTRLRAILLKDWQSLRMQSRKTTTPERPAIMRMKDSDDYITARGANPRTGLISPSVGTPSPHTPTPASPAEALKRRNERSAAGSPTRKEAASRPARRRANEGRKVSAGAGGTWRPKGNGWLIQGATSVALPKVTAAKATAAHALADEDRFVVKMPSAREPQPYAPGYSARKIEAYEHYREKARRVSSEGYDQRLIHVARKALCGAERPDGESGSKLAHAVRAFSGGHAPVPNRDITVLKRRAREQFQETLEPEIPSTTGAELNAATFAPFSSPKTLSLRSTQRTAAPLTTFASSRAEDERLHIHKPIARKPVAAGKNKLQSLPPMNLAHPSVAALPVVQRKALRREEDIQRRTCSLGCVRDAENGACTASNTSHKPHTPLFDGPLPHHESDTASQQQPSLHALYYLTDLLLAALLALYELSAYVPLPGVLVVLRSERASSRQKLESMKTLVCAVGQALGAMTAVAVVWNMGSLMVRVFEVVVWPVRVVRWVVGA